MSFSYAKFIARRGGVVLASGPPVESVPGPTRCCCDHSLQTWRSLKHECEHNPLCIVYVLGHPTIHTPGFRTRRTLSFLSAKYLDTEFQSYKLGLLQHSLHLSHSVPAVNQNSKVASSSGWASMAFNWSAHLLFRGQ